MGVSVCACVGVGIGVYCSIDAVCHIIIRCM